ASLFDLPMTPTCWSDRPTTPARKFGGRSLGDGGAAPETPRTPAWLCEKPITPVVSVDVPTTPAVYVVFTSNAGALPPVCPSAPIGSRHVPPPPIASELVPNTPTPTAVSGLGFCGSTSGMSFKPDRP